MWEYVQFASWIGMNIVWVGIVAGVSSYIGYHFGYNRGYEDGQRSMEDAEQKQDGLRR